MGCNVTALEPDEVLVVVNQYAGVNQQLADYYMQQREIPAGNMVKLWLSEEETISREMYEQKVAQPVRRFWRKMIRNGTSAAWRLCTACR